MSNIAQTIDQHRSTGRWVGNGVRVECQCGHTSEGSHDGGPVTSEVNAHRDADRKHAQHVAEMIEKAQQGITDIRWLAEEERRRGEQMSPHGTPGITYRAVERSRATKFQVSALELDYPHLAVADLLRQAAMSISREGAIPTQIKIDRASAKRGETITLTWFA